MTLGNLAGHQGVEHGLGQNQNPNGVGNILATLANLFGHLNMLELKFVN